MKSHSQFVCQQCGYVSSGTLGKCPNCESWNSFIETSLAVENNKRQRKSFSTIKPTLLSEVSYQKSLRIPTKIEELDRVLGGGIVPGSLVLISGDPGIGKSTLLLNVSANVGGLYVSGEESVEQIKLRAERLSISGKNLLLVSSTDTLEICNLIEEKKPKFVVIDSIQTMEVSDLEGGAGSVSQVRESAARFQKAAKENNIPLFVIGHVTKEGAIAGPKILEHLVDTVLYLEGERYQNLRILRSVKNRFGPTDEVGVFEMKDSGMREIKNPSEIFLNDDLEKEKIGSCATCTMEGLRPMMVEIQALVVPTQIPVPRRTVTGVDYNRVQLICAIIQKYLRIPLYSSDVFVSVTGGIKISEPACDLAIALSIISSFKNKALKSKVVAIGELGLLGEIRRVSQLERRIKESKKLGFSSVFSSEMVKTLGEIVQKIF